MGPWEHNPYLRAELMRQDSQPANDKESNAIELHLTNCSSIAVPLRAIMSAWLLNPGPGMQLCIKNCS